MNREIVIIMGYNAAGKSTAVNDFVSRGYKRLNRDTEGGTIDELHQKAQHWLASGYADKIVLDNTYPSIESRAFIIKIAKAQGVPIRCVHLTTSMEDAQLNACLRMIRKIGTIPCGKEFQKYKNDPSIFPVAAIYAYRKAFQAPTVKEGFDSVEELKFTRQWGSEYKNKAIFVDYDGTLRLSKGKYKFPTKKSEIEIMPNRIEVLEKYKNEGFLILGVSNQSGVDKGQLSYEECVQCFEDTNTMLDNLVDDFSFCPHKVPPISCYCRKPNAGMGALFIEKFKLHPSKCVMVGDMGSDKTFASRCGFKFIDASVFFRLS